MTRVSYTVTSKDLLDYKLKHYARKTLEKAVKKKIVRKAKFCELCGCDEFLHGHHVDYGKPLEAVWLCESCHGKAHRYGHDLNPEHNEQTPVDLSWNGDETIKVSFQLPVEHFIAMRKHCDENKIAVSKYCRGLVIKDLPLEQEETDMKFKVGYDDYSQYDARERIRHLEKNQKDLLGSKLERLAEIRGEGCQGLRGMA